MRPVRAAALLLVTFAASCSPKPAAPAAQASANSLRIVAGDFTFTAPDTVAAGVTSIVLVNQGKEPHQAVVMRIDSGKTPAEVQAGMIGNPIPSWVCLACGPTEAMPGDTTNATATLPPGNYILLCFLSGADGKPHL